MSTKPEAGETAGTENADSRQREPVFSGAGEVKAASARGDKVTFGECLRQCARTETLVQEFDRLGGTHLSKFDSRAPLDAMIDEATGRDDEAMAKFVAFVWEFVWIRLPPEIRATAPIESAVKP